MDISWGSEFIKRQEPTWLIHKILPARSLACLYAPQSQGKSFVGLELAGAITQGRPFGGHQTEQGIVIYMVGEGDDEMVLRLKTMHEAKLIDLDKILIVSDAPQLLQKGRLDEVKSAIWKIHPETGPELLLIIVDTLARHAVGVDENSAEKLGVLISAYDELAEEMDCSVLFIHHAGKDGDRGMRGSTALSGAVSTIIRCEKEGDELTLWCEKQRGAPEFEPIGFQYRQVNGSAVLNSVLANDHFTSDELLILDAIETSKSGIAATRDFMRSGGELPPPASLKRALDSLINRKKIMKVSRGKYANFQTST